MTAGHPPKSVGKVRRTRCSLLPATPPLYSGYGEGVRRRLWAALPFVPTMLASLLAVAVAGCQPSEERGSARQPIAAPADEAGQNDAAATDGNTPEASPIGSKAFTLLIEAQRDIDSSDMDSLEADAAGPLPPLLLTVELQRAPLRAVLRELAHRTQVTVTIADGVPERKLSLHFEQTPLEEAIRRILVDIPYELVYRDGATARGTVDHNAATVNDALVAIRVFAPGQAMANQAPALKPLSPEQPKAQIEAWKKRALEAREPKERLAALKQFLDHTDAAEHESMLHAALTDNAPEIRMLAINAIDSDFNPPLESISDLALNDESPQVRTTAVGVLLSRYGAAALPTFEQALADPDPSVQRTARSALEMTQRLNALFPRLAR